jgi:hypothetical protein
MGDTFARLRMWLNLTGHQGECDGSGDLVPECDESGGPVRCG